MMGCNGLQVVRVMATLRVLGPQKIRWRSLWIDRIEIREAEGIGVKRRRQQRHLTWPIPESRADFSRIDHRHIDNSRPFKSRGHTETRRSRPDNEHPCMEDFLTHHNTGFVQVH